MLPSGSVDFHSDYVSRLDFDVITSATSVESVSVHQSVVNNNNLIFYDNLNIIC